MRKILRMFVLGISLAFIIAASSGCFLLLGAAAGAGGYAYFQGKLEKNFDDPVAKVHQASLNALKNLEVFVRDDDVSKHQAKIIGEFDDGKKFTINIEALTERASKIQIRVGTFGDETKSYTLLNAIEKRL